jgi:peptidoglycan/LPS O-acetylase OafA/YrhL
MFGHWLFSRDEGYQHLKRLFSFTFPWGGTGVAVFFGISGYLITTLLVRERAVSGRVDIGAFYVRRAFRILPPLWLFLSVSLLIAPRIDGYAYLRTFFFTTDYLPTSPWLAHTWSLSVEEQFYVLWPVLFALLSLRSATRLAVALMMFAPAARVLALTIDPTRTLDNAFHLILDALMVGCLLALLSSQNPNHPVLRLLRLDLVAFIAVGFLLLGIPLAPRASRVVGYSLTPIVLSIRALSVGALLVWTTADRNARTWLVRVLNWKPAVHLGVISYGLYLWQQPILTGTGTTRWSDLPLPFLAVLALAETSYWLVERPSLVLRDRLLARRRSSGAPLSADALRDLEK